MVITFVNGVDAGIIPRNPQRLVVGVVTHTSRLTTERTKSTLLDSEISKKGHLGPNSMLSNQVTQGKRDVTKKSHKIHCLRFPAHPRFSLCGHLVNPTRCLTLIEFLYVRKNYKCEECDKLSKTLCKVT